ncbi:MAG: hypothetical protein K8R88_09475, partial [Armatimonadetes bacterium]|nr:hypothetical protein [Armatimonadota bacterium]
VSRVTPSKYDTAMCYVTMDGHRNNDFNPYVFVTKDYGKTWSKLNEGLPEGDCCYVIKEGTKNSDLLMLGTEMGLWISIDAGAKWTKFKSNFPTVAVHDIAIHPRDLDAVIGTHGRSIWTLNVSALEQMTDRAMNSVATVFKPQTAYSLGRTRGSGSEITHYRIPNSQPNGEVFFWIKDKPTAKPMILLQTAAGETLFTKQIDSKAGFQSVQFNTRELGTASRDIRVVLRIGESDYVTMMTVEDVSGNVQQTK